MVWQGGEHRENVEQQRIGNKEDGERQLETQTLGWRSPGNGLFFGLGDPLRGEREKPGDELNQTTFGELSFGLA